MPSKPTSSARLTSSRSSRRWPAMSPGGCWPRTIRLSCIGFPRPLIPPYSGAIPFSASSFLALAFLSRSSPMPRNTCGALVNWMLEYSMTSMRLPHGSRKSRNGPSTILAPAASARAFTLDRSSNKKADGAAPAARLLVVRHPRHVDELVAHVDEGAALAAAAQVEVEDL